MKISALPPLVVLAVLTACVVSLTAQQKDKKKETQKLKWRVQQLHRDNNEGLAVGDINGDGKLDITAGEFWYAAPDFKPQPVRKLIPFGADYVQNSSEHLYDMDGDGDLDIVTIAFTLSSIVWYENPGAGNYTNEGWTMHELIDTGVKANEAAFFHDIDKDGVPDDVDHCPDAAGKLEHSGCPTYERLVIKKQARAQGKALLSSQNRS